MKIIGDCIHAKKMNLCDDPSKTESLYKTNKASV